MISSAPLIPARKCPFSYIKPGAPTNCGTLMQTIAKTICSVITWAVLQAVQAAGAVVPARVLRRKLPPAAPQR